MSERREALAPVDFAERSWEAFRTLGLEAWTAYWADEIEVDMTGTGVPGFGVFRGRAAVHEMFTEWFGAFADYEAELLELRPVGEQGFFAQFRQRGIGRDSGAPVEGVFAHIGRVENGLLRRLRVDGDVARARRDAGLAD